MAFGASFQDIEYIWRDILSIDPIYVLVRRIPIDINILDCNPYCNKFEVYYLLLFKAIRVTIMHLLQ